MLRNALSVRTRPHWAFTIGVAPTPVAGAWLPAVLCLGLGLVGCSPASGNGSARDPFGMGDGSSDDVEGALGGAPPEEPVLGFVDDTEAPPELAPLSEEAACVASLVKAPLVRDPVDIIMIVDNSGSMSDELNALEQNINDNFAEILASAGSDYRFILITDHRSGPAGNLQTSICIESPLSGAASCRNTPSPTFSERFFHYSTLVQSGDSLEILLDTFANPFDSALRRDRFGRARNGWSEWTRPGVRKVMVEMTDDASDLAPEDFLQEFASLAPDDFNAAQEPLFAFHSVVGLAGKSQSGEPYLSDEQIQEDSCEKGGLLGADPGEDYQRLSQLTGGLRFSLCDFESFDAVFRQIAGDVVVDSALSCDLPIPAAPGGQSIDLDRVAVTVQSEGATTTLGQIVSPDNCSADAFYLDSDQIHLCPEACEVIQTDALAQVDVLFACESQIIVR